MDTVAFADESLGRLCQCVVATLDRKSRDAASLAPYCQASSTISRNTGMILRAVPCSPDRAVASAISGLQASSSAPHFATCTNGGLSVVDEEECSRYFSRFLIVS